MKIKQLAEIIRSQMPKGLDELETLRYIYIYLGKNKRFDPVYYFADRKTMDKIHKLSKKKMKDEEFLTEKRNLVCITISSLLKLVAREFDIQVDVARDEDGHTYNIARLKNGIIILLDLQQDLKFIHTNRRTENFGQGNAEYYEIPDSKLEYIDEKIGYKKPNENYKNEEICRLAEQTKSMTKLDAFIHIMEDLEFNETVNNTNGYIEGVNYIKMALKEAKLKDYTHIVNCYRDEDINNELLQERQYTPLIYAKDKKDLVMYIFKKKAGRFVPISPIRFKKLNKQGLQVFDDMYSKRLVKIISSIDDKEL